MTSLADVQSKVQITSCLNYSTSGHRLVRSPKYLFNSYMYIASLEHQLFILLTSNT